jgi:hypothetical protein
MLEKEPKVLSAVPLQATHSESLVLSSITSWAEVAVRASILLAAEGLSFPKQKSSPRASTTQTHAGQPAPHCERVPLRLKHEGLIMLEETARQNFHEKVTMPKTADHQQSVPVEVAHPHQQSYCDRLCGGPK